MTRKNTREILYGQIRWPKVKPNHDTNMVDVPYLGQLLVKGMERPAGLPAIPPSLETVQRIEDFVRGAEARRLPGATLYEHYLAASNDSPLWFAAATELWLGCIGMAKLTRVSYVTASGLALYTPSLRKAGYNRLLMMQVYGSPWLIWGMTLAQELSESRGDPGFAQEVPFAQKVGGLHKK